MLVNENRAIGPAKALAYCFSKSQITKAMTGIMAGCDFGHGKKEKIEYSYAIAAERTLEKISYLNNNLP